jgi:hypothetical protein
VRRILRSRARYEMANNSYAKGDRDGSHVRPGYYDPSKAAWKMPKSRMSTSLS